MTTRIIPSSDVANHSFRDHPPKPWRIFLSQFLSAVSLILLLPSGTFLILSHCSWRSAVMFGMWIQQWSSSNLRYPHASCSLTHRKSNASLFCKVNLALAWTFLLIIWNPFWVALDKASACQVRFFINIGFSEAIVCGKSKLWHSQLSCTVVDGHDHVSGSLLLTCPQYGALIGLFFQVGHRVCNPKATCLVTVLSHGWAV